MTATSRAAAYYEWIKALVRCGDRSVTLAACTGIAMASYGDFGHGAYPAVATVAEGLGLSERQVRHHLFMLIVTNKIYQHKRWGATDVYCIRLDGEGAEHVCRYVRKPTSDNQDSLSREALQQGAPSGDGSRFSDDGDQCEALVSQIAGGSDLSQQEHDAVVSAIRNAIVSGGRSRRDVKAAVEQLLQKRKMGLLVTPVITESVVAAFVANYRGYRRAGSPSRGSRSLTERKDQALAVAQESEHLGWYFRITNASGAELREVLDLWDKSRSKSTTNEEAS